MNLHDHQNSWRLKFSHNEIFCRQDDILCTKEVKLLCRQLQLIFFTKGLEKRYVLLENRLDYY